MFDRHAYNMTIFIKFHENIFIKVFCLDYGVLAEIQEHCIGVLKISNLHLVPPQNSYQKKRCELFFRPPTILLSDTYRLPLKSCPSDGSDHPTE